MTALRVSDPFVLHSARETAFDVLQRLAPRRYIDAPVRIVDIDERSLELLGHWPWPRDKLAELVDRLAEEGHGALVLGAHLGSFDALRLLAERVNTPVNILVFTENAQHINRVFRELSPNSEARVIAADATSSMSNSCPVKKFTPPISTTAISEPRRSIVCSMSSLRTAASPSRSAWSAASRTAAPDELTLAGTFIATTSAASAASTGAAIAADGE